MSDEYALPVGVIRWGNLPVPYVAAWSSEDAPYIGRDPLIGNQPAVMRNGRRGEGRPLFGKMDERRTRRVVVQGRCQVCAQPLRGDSYIADRVLFVTARRNPVINEPPACQFCFALALSMCPGIARLRSDPRVLVARVQRFDPLLVAIQPVADGGTPEINAALAKWNGKTPIIGYARPEILQYDLLNAADLKALAAEPIASVTS